MFKGFRVEAIWGRKLVDVENTAAKLNIPFFTTQVFKLKTIKIKNKIHAYKLKFMGTNHGQRISRLNFSNPKSSC